MRLVKNELQASSSGALQARATDRVEELRSGSCSARSLRGVPVPGVPFDEKAGVI